MFESLRKRQIISGFTLLAFSVSLWTPHAFANGLYRTEMTEVSEEFNDAQIFLSPEADYNSYLDYFEAELSKEDREFLTKQLVDMNKIQVKVVNSELHFTSKDAPTVKVKISDFDKGVFKINGKDFRWNDSEGLEKNVNRMIPLVDSKGYGFNFNTIWNQIVPSAHAAILPIVAILGGVGLILWGLRKRRKNKEIKAVEREKERIFQQEKRRTLRNGRRCGERVDLGSIYSGSSNIDQRTDSLVAYQQNQCLSAAQQPYTGAADQPATTHGDPCVQNPTDGIADCK